MFVIVNYSVRTVPYLKTHPETYYESTHTFFSLFFDNINKIKSRFFGTDLGEKR